MVDLDAVLHLEAITRRVILNKMLTNTQNMRTFRDLTPGSYVDVQHDFVHFRLTYEEVQEVLALWRMRGGKL